MLPYWPGTTYVHLAAHLVEVHSKKVQRPLGNINQVPILNYDLTLILANRLQPVRALM